MIGGGGKDKKFVGKIVRLIKVARASLWHL